MQPQNRSRLIYALAGQLMHQEWTAPALKSALQLAMMQDHPIAPPTLWKRLIEAFPTRPEYRPLVAFLRADQGLQRALRRPSAKVMLLSLRRALKVQAMSPPPPGLAGIAFPNLANEAALAAWLGLDLGQLQWLADITGRNRKHRAGPLRTYRCQWIPKRQGRARLLEIPCYRLKITQRKILSEILELIPGHPAVHGFRKGRSIITNAAPHCGRQTLLRFDLTDFFPSVTAARVQRIFRTLGYPRSVARLLTGLCTTTLPADAWDARPGATLGGDFQTRQRLITRHLPQGAPTSPALANLAAFRLDRRLHALAIKLDATYTRYADDLAFSGDRALSYARKRLATLVAVIADEEGFALNHRKTRIMRAGRRQHVTGVIVNVHLNLPRAEFDRLKAILTNCIRHGPDSQNRENLPDFRGHLTGKVAHVASVNSRRGEKLRRLLQRIEWE